MRIPHIGSKKGLTLIELVITLAIIMIVVAASFTFFSFGNLSFAGGNQQFQIQSDVRLAAEYIEKNIRFATSAEIQDSPVFDTNEKFEYFLIDGSVLKHGSWDGPANANTIIFQADLSLDPESEFSLQTNTIDESVIVTLKGVGEMNKEFSIQKEVLLPNLNIAGISVKDTSTTSPKALIFSYDATLLSGGTGGTGGGSGGSGGSGGDLTYDPVTADKNWLKDVIPREISGSSSNVHSGILLPTVGPNGNEITWSTTESPSTTSAIDINIFNDNDRIAYNFPPAATKQGNTNANVTYTSTIKATVKDSNNQLTFTITTNMFNNTGAIGNAKFGYRVVSN